MKENVVLVDQKSNEVGVAEKLQAHKDGLLHRAFSIFVFNSNKELLLQKRAKAKYHSGGLWSNTCCSHPRPGELLRHAVHRRLQEEMGFDCSLEEMFSYVYKVTFDNGLTEHELDHVFRGMYEGEFYLNPEEAEDAKWVSWEFLLDDVDRNPEMYSYWFKEIIRILKENGTQDSFCCVPRTYNKLVRDRIPEIIRASNLTPVTRIAEDNEYLKLLQNKLVEETGEFVQRPALEELADVVEVVYALIEVLGASRDELEVCRREKAEKRGVFSERIVLCKTTR